MFLLQGEYPSSLLQGAYPSSLLQGEYLSSSAMFTRKVQVVAQGSSGVLTRQFRKIDRGPRHKAVQVQ
jgi:hypothetical protein